MKLIFFFLLYSLLANAQSIDAKKINQYTLNADKFWGVDTYQNIYYSKNNIFFKQNPELKTTQQQFKDFSLGTLSSVDIINPLNILLFYKNSNTVILLDNRLNKLAEYSLNNISPLRTISHAKLAGNRHLWLFNVDTQRLEVFDLSKDQATSRSLPISKKLIQLETNFKKAWLVLPDTIKVYDWYANQIKTITRSFKKIKTDNAQILALTKDEKYFYSRKGDDFIKVTNIKVPGNSFYFTDQKLYIYAQQKLTIYQIVLKF